MKKYFYLSFIFHLLIFLLLLNVVTFDHSISEEYVVMPARLETLSSTVLSAPQKKSSSRTKASTHLAKDIKLRIDPHLRKDNSSPIVARNHFAKNDKPKNQFLLKGDTHYTEFLKIIHNKITSHQQYPSSALLLNQSGTVTLQFNVYPNGQMDQMIILKSSGFSNLDQAALHALQSIGHFKQAYLYLKKTTTFSVDVIFV